MQRAQDAMISVPVREDDGGIADLRAKILLVLLLSFSVGSCVIAALVTFQAVAEESLPPTLIVGLVAACLLMVLLAVRRHLSYRTTAIAFVLHAGVVATYLQSFHGLNPGTALATVAFLLLTAMFLGVRAMAWVLILALASLAGSALVVTRGWVVPWATELWDPHRPIVWLRYLMVLLFLGGGLTFALAYLVDGIEDAAKQLARLRKLERVERERREAMQHALERSRRLEAMAHFAGGVVHDFNNSLIVILALAHRIESDARAPAHLTSLAASIRQGVEVSAETVRGLLSFSRADASAPRRVRLDRLLRRSELAIRALFAEQVTVTLATDYEGWILVDVARFQQALLNLAVNARDAMPEGGVFRIEVDEVTRTELALGWKAGPGRYVVVTCKDTGIGMDELTCEQAFEPFFTTKAPNRGTGLGLATVHGVVYDANGFIEVESTPGHGTAVRMHFPKPAQHLSVSDTWD
jgi:signal transduction histidine kinase